MTFPRGEQTGGGQLEEEVQMVETGAKTQLMMTRTQPTGNAKEEMQKLPPGEIEVAVVVMKMRAKMRLQGENGEGQLSKRKAAEPRTAVRRTVM